MRFAHTAPFHIEVAGKPLRPRKAEVEFLISRMEGELARNAEVLPAAALEEYREALRIYQGIARRRGSPCVHGRETSHNTRDGRYHRPLCEITVIPRRGGGR